MPNRQGVPTGARAVGVLVAVLLAASCNADAPPKPVAAGQGWTRVIMGRPLPEATAFVSTIARVDVNKTGLWLALGATSAAPGALQKPGTWASADNLNWAPIGMPVEVTESGSVEAAASDNQLGLVGGAIGTGRGAVPTVWSSTDAWTWQDPVRLPLPPDTHGAVVHSIAKGPGGWVATGGAADGGDGPPLLWSSADGRSWNLADPGPLPRSHAGWAVVATGDRYVAVVSTNRLGDRERQEPAVVLSSADGRTWQRQALPGFARPIVIRAALRIRDWFVVPVDCCATGEPARLAVSRDGVTWTAGLSLEGLAAVPDEQPAAAFAVTSLAERQGRLVAWSANQGALRASETSPTQNLEDRTAAAAQAWVPIGLPAAPPQPYTTSAPGQGAGRVAAAGPSMVVDRPSLDRQNLSWTLGDGKWIAAAADVPPPARQSTETVHALSANDQTAVAVGQATYIPLTEGDAPRPAAARLWVSSGELLTWDEIIINGNINDLRGVATDGQRFVAVGVNNGHPALLVSKDGKQWLQGRAGVAIDDIFDSFAAPATSAPSTSAPDPIGTIAGPGTTAVPEEPERVLFDDEVPTTVVRFHDRFFVRTDAGHLWSSADGGTWSLVALPDEPGGTGLVESTCASDSTMIARPYRTTDGEHWDLVPALAPDRELSRACGVSPDGSALFVVLSGEVRPGTPLRLLAGQELEPRSLDDGSANGVGRDGRSWLLLGRSDLEVPGDAAVWTSTDATTWQPLTAASDLVHEHGSGRLTTSLVWKDKLLLGGTHADAGLVLIGPPAR